MSNTPLKSCCAPLEEDAAPYRTDWNNSKECQSVLQEDVPENANIANGQTAKTAKTIVGNPAFIDALFHDLDEKQSPIVVGFRGNPKKIAPAAWIGKPWQHGVLTPDDANNYVSISAFKRDEAGVYLRRKTHFVEQRAVMLDDIGTKVSPRSLNISPSWLLETSLGNFQAGYILTIPIRNPDEATCLMNQIIEKGLCDAGANGPMTRLMRLPVGVNGKHTPAFRCCLREWYPERRYSVEELREGLGLADVPPPQLRPIPPIAIRLQDIGDAYIRAAVRRGVDAVMNAAEGTRNAVLNQQAWSLMRFAQSGGIGAQEIAASLYAAACAAGLGHHEIVSTLASAIRARGLA